MPAPFSSTNKTFITKCVHSDDIGILSRHDKTLIYAQEKFQSKKRSRSMGFFTPSTSDDSLHSSSSRDSSTYRSVQEREPSVHDYRALDIINTSAALKTMMVAQQKETTRTNYHHDNNDHHDDGDDIPRAPIEMIEIRCCPPTFDDESCQSSIVSDITENSWLLDVLEPLFATNYHVDETKLLQHEDTQDDDHDDDIVPPPTDMIYISDTISCATTISLFDDEVSFFDYDDDDNAVDNNDTVKSSFDLLDVILLLLKISVTFALFQQLYRNEFLFSSMMTLSEHVVDVVSSHIGHESLMKGIESFVSVAILYGCFVCFGYRPARTGYSHVC